MYKKNQINTKHKKKINKLYFSIVFIVENNAKRFFFFCLLITWEQDR